MSLERDAQRDDHRILGECFAIEDHGHELAPVQAPLTEGLQVAGAGPDETAQSSDSYHQRETEPNSR